MLGLLLVELARSTLGSGELNMRVRRRSEACERIASLASNGGRIFSERCPVSADPVFGLSVADGRDVGITQGRQQCELIEYGVNYIQY